MNKRVKLFFVLGLILFFGCSESGNKNQISESGTIEATNIFIASQSNGTVKKIFFNEGDKISKGDTLLIINHSLLDIQLKQALAAQKAVQAQYDFLKNGARAEDIFLAKQKLTQAKAAYILAQKNLGRMKKLLFSKSITQKKYDDVKANFDIALSKYKSAQENLKKLNKFARPEELKKAKANVELSAEKVAFVKKQIDNCYVVSPINGVLVERYVELGELALPSTTLLKVADLTHVNLYVYVSETDMGKIKLGDKVTVAVDSYPDKVFTGKISFISPEAEFTPKNIQTKEERTKLVFKVKIAVPNPNYVLKSGMPADAVIRLTN